MSLTKCYLNAAKYQGYSFSRFWIIKGKPTGGEITPHPKKKHTHKHTHTQIRVKRLTLTVCWKVVSPVVGTTHKGLWWLQRRFDSNIYVKTTKTWLNLITLIWKLKAEEEKYKYQNIASASFHLKLNITGKSLDCKTCYTQFFIIFDGFFGKSSLNTFQSSVTFHVKPSHLFCLANQMTGFYMNKTEGWNGLTRYSGFSIFATLRRIHYTWPKLRSRPTSMFL